MAERKPAPKQRKPKSRAWVWWVLAIVVVGGVGYRTWLVRRELTESVGQLMNGEIEEISGMRKICSANISYQYGHPKQGYARTLRDLGSRDGNYIDDVLASGEKSDYRYEYVARPDASGFIDSYRVTARPRPFGPTGGRSFYMDENCEVHATKENRAATAADPILQ